MTKRLTLEGYRFGKLTVIAAADKNKFGRVCCECRCDCGNVKTISGSSLRSGHSASCGCLKKEKMREIASGQKWARIDPQISAMTLIYSSHKGSATSRGWEPLPKPLYFALAIQDCATCGSKPKRCETAKNNYIRNCNAKNAKINETYAKSKVFYCNGIDRIDSSKGYEMCNVQPMCEKCNVAKSDYTQEEFEEHILRAAAHISARRNKT